MPRVIIVPVTSQIQTVHPFQVLIQIDGKDGKVMTDQIRCIDKARLKGKLASISFVIMQKIEASIQLCIGIK